MKQQDQQQAITHQMKSGTRSRILLGLFLLSIALVEMAPVRADWNDAAWPSDETWQDEGRFTNVYAKVSTVIFTNYSPSSSTAASNIVSVWTNTAAVEIRFDTNVWLSGFGVSTGFFPTNIWFDVREIRCADAYQSEREVLLAAFYLVAAGDSPDPDDFTFLFPPYFYRSERENLIELKRPFFGVGPVVYGYLDTNLMVSGSFDAVDASTFDFEWLSITSVLASAGAPTNWPDYTPYRALNGAGYQMGGIMTNQMFVYDQNYTNGATVIVTNSDGWGNAHVITGANNSVVDIIAVNSAILPGYNTGDYGWKHWPAIRAQFKMLVMGGAVGAPDIKGVHGRYGTRLYEGLSAGPIVDDPSCSNPVPVASWADAKADAEADAPFGVTGSDPSFITWTSGNYGDNQPQDESCLVEAQWIAEMLVSSNVLYSLVNTNFHGFVFDATAYDFAGAPTFGNTNTFDGYGTPFLVTNTWYEIGALADVTLSGTNNEVEFAMYQTTPPVSPWVDDPAPMTQTVFRGFFNSSFLGAGSPHIVYEIKNFEFGNFIP